MEMYRRIRVALSTFVVLALCIPHAFANSPVNLVVQLGDTSFAVREQAYEELQQLGSSARDALEGGLKHADGEIRSRCRELLARLDSIDSDVRLKSFLENSGTQLPGWQRYRELIAGADRRKFAELHRSSRGLFEAIERDPKEAKKLLLSRAIELQERFLISPRSVELAEITALLLAADDARLNLDAAGYRGVLGAFDTVTHWKEVREKVQADVAARTLLIAVLNRLPEVALHLEALTLMTRLELREGLPLARRCLADRALPPSTRAAALLLFGRVGGKEHAVELEVHLQDTGVIGTKLLRTTTLGTQVCDVALAMIVHLRGADPAEMGFPYPRAIPGPLFGYAPTCFGFANDNDRAAAFERWTRSRGQR